MALTLGLVKFFVVFLSLLVKAKRYLKQEPERFLHFPISFLPNHPSVQHYRVSGTMTLYEHQINESPFMEQGNWQIEIEIVKHIYLTRGF